MENSNEENSYFRAKEKVDALKKFYGSLLSYAVITLVLAGINYWVNEWRNMWFLWAVFGFGIDLAFKGAKVYGNQFLFGKDWERRKMEEFMREDKRNGDRWE